RRSLPLPLPYTTLFRSVLAIAARRLGGDGVAAIDFDRDALHSAAENVALNEVDGIAVHHADITEGGQALLDRHGRPGGFDLVLADRKSTRLNSSHVNRS